jgi:hypothetical protein
MELLTKLLQQHVDAVPAVMLGQILDDTERPVSDEEASGIRSNVHVMPNELMPIGGSPAN